MCVTLPRGVILYITKAILPPENLAQERGTRMNTYKRVKPVVLSQEEKERELRAMESTTAQELRELAGDEHPAIRLKVAGNPHCTEEALATLVQTGNDELWKAVVMHEAVTEKILEMLANTGSRPLQKAVALHLSSSAETLQNLLESGDVGIRGHVAQNLSLTATLFNRLAHDEESWVRYQVATNPNVPTDTLMELAQDRDALVRTTSESKLSNI